MPEAISARYDVVILGSGLGGSMLASILAKRGVSVLMVEELVHPRFTIGESLIPETGIRLQLLAEKYGVPEIAWLGSFHALRDNVSSNCGTKRAFSFIYHRPGEEARGAECNQLPTLTPPFGPDSHLFRQDTDAWMATLSTLYGATLRQQLRIEAVDFRPDQVVLTAKTGEKIACTFLIDAAGMRSMVSDHLKLRDATPRFRTDTRALFNHFIGLPPIDALVRDHGQPSPLSQGTMHHIFDGGWMWLIAFNNHRDATNPLTSVGLVLDRRKFPNPVGTPEEEFRSIISRFPTIARSFEGAVPVRPWVGGAGRLQYSSPRLIGPRMIQLPHAAAFVDPLFSSGLSVLTVAVDLIAESLLPALADGNFAEERFERINQVVNDGFDHYDNIISRAFDSFASYDLWNAWNRNWVMGNFLGTFGVMGLLLRYYATGDRSWLDRTTEPGRVGVLGSHLPEVKAVMQASGLEIDAVTRGELSAAEASARIFARLGSQPFLPPYMGFGDPDRHFPGVFTLQSGARHVLWYRHFGPPEWKERCTFPLTTYASMVAGALGRAAGGGIRRGWSQARDVFSAGNSDWQHAPAALHAQPLEVWGRPGHRGRPEHGADAVTAQPDPRAMAASPLINGGAPREAAAQPMAPPFPPADRLEGAQLTTQPVAPPFPPADRLEGAQLTTQLDPTPQAPHNDVEVPLTVPLSASPRVEGRG